MTADEVVSRLHELRRLGMGLQLETLVPQITKLHEACGAFLKEAAKPDDRPDALYGRKEKRTGKDREEKGGTDRSVE